MIIRRETKQRQMVLQAVQARKDHPTADQIFNDVHKLDPKISHGTVYRNLNLLCEDGLICHVRVPGADRFDLRTDLHYHIRHRGAADLGGSGRGHGAVRQSDRHARR